MENKKQNGDEALVVIAVVAVSVATLALGILAQACAILPAAILNLGAGI